MRCKQIDVSDNTKWDLIPLNDVTEEQIKAYFSRTLGCKYDWWGALGIVLGIKQKRSKYFCSEWCFNAIYNSDEGWRFSQINFLQWCVKMDKTTINLYRGDDEECTVRLFEKLPDKTLKPLDLSDIARLICGLKSETPQC